MNGFNLILRLNIYFHHEIENLFFFQPDQYTSYKATAAIQGKDGPILMNSPIRQEGRPYTLGSLSTTPPPWDGQEYQ